MPVVRRAESGLERWPSVFAPQSMQLKLLLRKERRKFKLGRGGSDRSQSRNGSKSSIISIETIGSQISDEPVDPVHSTLEHMEHRLLDFQAGILAAMVWGASESLFQAAENFYSQVREARTATSSSESNQLLTSRSTSRTERPLVIICDEINLLIKSIPTRRGVQELCLTDRHAEDLLVKLLAIQGDFDLWRHTYMLPDPETIWDPPSPPAVPDFRPTSTVSMMAIPLPFSGSTVPSTAALTQLSPPSQDPTPTQRLQMQLQPPTLQEFPIPTSHSKKKGGMQTTWTLSAGPKRRGIVSRIFKSIKNRVSLLA